MDLVFDGWIAGLGTASGHRFVVGSWLVSPFGPATDVMHEDPAGRRVLLAPTAELADFVAGTYRFDEVRVVPVTARPAGPGLGPGRGWTTVVVAAELRLSLTVGRRTAVGRLLRLVPPALARRSWWVAAIDLPARVVLPGVRTRGSAGGGRREWYAALDHRRIESARAALGGTDLGALAPVDPPVRFGFGSVPSRPSWTRVVTTVRVP